MSEQIIIHPSALARRIACPGSARMEIEAARRGIVPEPSKDADEGTRLHKRVAERIRAKQFEPNEDDEWEVNSCVDFFVKMRDLHVNTSPPDSTSYASRIAIEETITWSHIHTVDGRRVVLHAEGTPDVLLLLPSGIAVVFDWKFGHDQAADHETQMRGYCAIVNRDTFAYVHNPRFGWVSYGLKAAECIALVTSAHAVCSQPDAPLVPGDHCKYCPAASACPALLSNVANPQLPTVADAIMLATPAQLAAWGDRLPIVERACKKLRERLKQMVGTIPESFPNWELREKGGNRSADSTALYDLFVNRIAALTAAEFMECVSASVAEIEKKYAEKRKPALGTKKAAIEEFKEKTADIVTQGRKVELKFKGEGEEDEAW